MFLQLKRVWKNSTKIVTTTKEGTRKTPHISINNCLKLMEIKITLCHETNVKEHYTITNYQLVHAITL